MTKEAVRPWLATVLAIACLQISPVVAQSPGEKPATYGTSSDIILNLGPDDFVVSGSAWTNAFINDRIVFPTTDNSFLSLVAPLHLPNGALVTSITYFYLDSEVPSEPSAQFNALNATNAITGTHLTFFPTWSAGFNSVTSVLPSPMQINNQANHYSINVNLHRLDGNNMQALTRVRVTYRLQVSPAPGTASFGDVPVGSPFHRFVEALVASGITGGCGGGNYCPDTFVTRGQMAVFIAAALGLHWPN